MQKFFAAAAALALAPVAAQANTQAAVQTGNAAPADHSAHAAAQSALTLDTPVEVIVARPEGKAVLEANLPGITTHEHYEMFKAMSLRQLAGMAPERLPPEALAKVEAGLAAVK